jgi:hypothetical protein
MVVCCRVLSCRPLSCRVLSYGVVYCVVLCFALVSCGGALCDAMSCDAVSYFVVWGTGGKDREVKVWDLVKSEEICVLLGHKAPITALHMTEGGRFIFSGDAAGVLLVSVAATWMGERVFAVATALLFVLARFGTASRTTTAPPSAHTPPPSPPFRRALRCRRHTSRRWREVSPTSPSSARAASCSAGRQTAPLGCVAATSRVLQAAQPLCDSFEKWLTSWVCGVCGVCGCVTFCGCRRGK